VRWFIHGLREYANFHGRASRTEFWHFWWVCFGVESAGRCLLFRAPLPAIFLIWSFTLLTATPFIAVSTRRLHDTGHTGWLLAKSGALMAAQAAFWFGVALTHGKDALAWAAAVAALAMQLTVSLILFYFYCQPTDPKPNRFGAAAPEVPRSLFSHS